MDAENPDVAGDDGLIAAYLLDGRGGGKEIGWPGIDEWRPGDGLLWVHLDHTRPRGAAWIHGRENLDPVVREALTAEETRPRATTLGEGLLVALRGVNLNPGANPEDMVSASLWVQENFIVTTRTRKLLSIQDIRDALHAGRGPRSAGEFLTEVADRLILRMAGVIDDIDDQVADLEHTILETESRELRTRLAGIRRQAITLRRYMAPQREAMSRLLVEKVDWLTDVDRIQLREVADRLTRYLEDLDAARERAGVMQEELAGRLSEQINSRMYVMSLAAVIFLPLGFLTGLLGVNVGGIPGAEFGGGFVIVCIVLVIVVAAQIWIFRRNRWI
ncbi:MAG: zinc transporter ZntB [Gammaproteobacteria bacterium]